MKMTKAEWAAVLVTLALVMFSAGFFAGRHSVPAAAVISEDRETAASPAVSPEASPAASQANSPVVPTAEPGTSETPALPLDLNTATQAELENLPGIGEVMARRILEYRVAQGGFSAVEELKNVSGIGDKTYETIKDLVKVEEENENSSGR